MRTQSRFSAQACSALIATTVLGTAALAQAKPAATVPPSLAAPKALTLPSIVERTLPNGLRIIVVEHHELPLVDVTVVMRTGSEADPQGKTGLATLTAGLLTDGAGTRDATAMAEEIGYLAVRLFSGAGFDQSTVTLHATKATLDSAMTLLSDVVLRPTFAAADFARQKSSRLTSLLQEIDRGPALADRAFNAIVFGDKHPYGHSASGTKDDVQSITREDVQHFWSTWYRPNNATVIVVGDLTVNDAVQRVTRAFMRSAPRCPRWPPARLAPAAATTIYIVDKPKAPQTSFRIGGLGVARSTKDYYPIMVMNTALGGSFASRLNQNLRETKGYTYGAGSGFAMRREPGAFTARGEIVAAKTDSALIEFMKELSNIREPMSAVELAKTKRYLQLGYAERFESTGDIAQQIASLVTHRHALDIAQRIQCRHRYRHCG